MLVATAPNWLGSPHHFFGGIALALVVFVVARLFGLGSALACTLAIGLTSTVEILVELVEYPLLYADHFHASAYHDTLADMANSIVGGVVGAAIGVGGGLLSARKQRSRRAGA